MHARFCSCSRRAGRRRVVVCACVCVPQPACGRNRGSNQMGADAAPCGRAGCSLAVFDACAYQKHNLDFLKLTRLIQPRPSPSTAWKHMIIHMARDGKR